MNQKTELPTISGSVSSEMAVFVAVVDYGGFAPAARAVGLTPSAVSKTINRLETRLGVKLLHRTTRTISLTEEGRVFLEHTRGVLSAIEVAEAEVAALRAEPSGLIKITVGSAYAKHCLVPELPVFLKKFPKISVDLNVTDEVVDLFADNADIAIRPGPVGGVATRSLHVTLLSTALRHLCASSDYLRSRGEPQHPEDLLNHNCILMSVAGRAGWPFQYADNRYYLEVSGDVSADNADMLLDLALAGHGIVRLLDTIVGPSLANGKLVSIMEDTHLADKVPVSAFTRQGRQLIPRIAVLLEHLRKTQTNPGA